MHICEKLFEYKCVYICELQMLLFRCCQLWFIYIRSFTSLELTKYSRGTGGQWAQAIHQGSQHWDYQQAPKPSIVHGCWERSSFFSSRHFKLNHSVNCYGSLSVSIQLPCSWANLSCDISCMNATHFGPIHLSTLLYLLPNSTTVPFFHQVSILTSWFCCCWWC